MPFHPLVEPAADLADDYVARTAHQLILAEVGAVGQRRVRAARVLVVSADEVGGPAIAALADAGVGALDVVDGAALRDWDRCGGVPSGGGPRSTAWARALRETHPWLTVTAHESRFDVATAALVAECDLVVCGSEDPAVCYLVDDACAEAGKPWVWAGLGAVEGRLSVFWAEHGPTYRHLHPQPPAPHFRGMAGALTALGAWLGAAAAAEAVKLVTGRGEPLVGRVAAYDVAAGELSTRALTGGGPVQRPSPLTSAPPFFGLLSPQAAEAARESTISATELKQLIDSGADLHIVDVREADEHALVDLPGSVLVPKARFLEGDAARDLPVDRKVVLFCRMGIRSAEALAVVKAHGHPDAVHLGGGVLAWVKEVDPSLPVY
ncbi:ThiF family adenylyltransferase [Actinosynnema pretiosum]|uniref:Rhodanese domain-containing protein n=1 Tax=Actinosynnema pretiosum TaxID=42197 RepID=A0A290Z6L3_9PSEU|nr:ThiF family adenylyltransferase [Actinosynnema pretiosum]ATE54603.1 hypothetical protein CNX65_15970 [Actinosynnema pretiosum]